jgi:uncharacterized PurR-regulated membrane protein YhhQ (DUF165 family)
MLLRIEIAYLAMITLIVTSNVLVLYPINDWLTWAAFPYAISYLISELSVNLFGTKKARSIVYTGFTVGVLISFGLSTPRIAIASGIAFLFSQLLDIAIFRRLRQNSTWWIAPLSASILASLADSAMFWTIGFYGEDVPIITWALGDTAVKFAVDIGMLVPFRIAISKLTQPYLGSSSKEKESASISKLHTSLNENF